MTKIGCCGHHGWRATTASMAATAAVTRLSRGRPLRPRGQQQRRATVAQQQWLDATVQSQPMTSTSDPANAAAPNDGGGTGGVSGGSSGGKK
jgi:hypothetical protein